MALQVRTIGGDQDVYSRYPGCTQCASPMAADDQLDRCPVCEAEVGRNRYYYNQEVLEESDGSLTICLHGRQTGRYLPGSWSSYRYSD